MQQWLTTQQVPPASRASSHIASVVASSTSAELQAALLMGAEAALLACQASQGSQLSHATQRTRRSRQFVVLAEVFTKLADNLVHMAGQQREDAIMREQMFYQMKSDTEKAKERERLQLEVKEREKGTEKERLQQHETAGRS